MPFIRIALYYLLGFFFLSFLTSVCRRPAYERTPPIWAAVTVHLVSAEGKVPGSGDRPPPGIFSYGKLLANLTSVLQTKIMSSNRSAATCRPRNLFSVFQPRLQLFKVKKFRTNSERYIQMHTQWRPQSVCRILFAKKKKKRILDVCLSKIEFNNNNEKKKITKSIRYSKTYDNFFFFFIRHTY